MGDKPLAQFDPDLDPLHVDAHPQPRIFRWWLALILLIVITRLPAVIHPRPINDEDFYMVAAIEILDGGKPYVDVVERKPPLLLWTYALLVGLVGPYNWSGIHLASVLWTLFTMAGVYAVGRQLFDAKTGLIAASLYGIFLPWAGPSNLALNGEMLMNLPIIWAYFLGLRPSGSRLRLELLLAGALLCTGFLLKQPAAIAAVPLGLYLLSSGYRTTRHLTGTHSMLHAVLLVVGFFGVLGVVATVLWNQGILRETIYWTITDNDVPHGPLDPVFWRYGLAQSLAFVAACAPLVLGGVMSLAGRFRGVVGWADRRPELFALVGLLIASAVGVSASGRFYAHYYIQLVLPLAVLAAPVFMHIWTSTSGKPFWLFRPRVTQAWLAFMTAGFLLWHTWDLRQVRDISEVARYVRMHSAPDDRIFVWGQAITIYADAERRPASRYTVTYPLTGYIQKSPLTADPDYDTSDRIHPGAWEILEEELLRDPPRYIVDTEAVNEVPKYHIDRFPILQRILVQHYEPVHRAPRGVIYRRVASHAPGL